MKTWIIGNWKNNPATTKVAQELAESITVGNTALSFKLDEVDGEVQQHMVIPSTVHLSSVHDVVKDSQVLMGTQDVGKMTNNTGAYTGDCSAAQLKDIGASWTLVGHSERRQYYQEDNHDLAEKTVHAFSQELGVILCIGESLEEYEAKETLNVLKTQLQVLNLVAEATNMTNNNQSLIVAYEPVWAIGTGKVPTVAEVEDVHKFIKDELISINKNLADVAIIYGGSVNTDNAEQFAESQWIQGALIGGASLQAEKFLNIAKIFYETKAR